MHKAKKRLTISLAISPMVKAEGIYHKQGFETSGVPTDSSFH